MHDDLAGQIAPRFIGDHCDRLPGSEMGAVQSSDLGYHLMQATQRLVRLYVKALMTTILGPNAANACVPAHCKQHTISASETILIQSRTLYPP